MKNKLVKRLIAMCLCSAVLMGCGSNRPVILEEPASEEVPIMSGENANSGNSASESSDRSDTEGKELAPVKLTGIYERATYLADMVYEKNGTANTMVSPLSLDMALGLVSGGANGQTKEELLTYLGTEDYGQFAERYMEYVKGLNYAPTASVPAGYDRAYEIANSIWVKNDRKLVDSYVDLAKEQYDAEVRAVSFQIADREKTVGEINAWCNEKTHELIPEIINKESLSDDAVAILLNSLYFECPWREKWRQTTHIFTDFQGKETEQQMLCDTLTTYYENEHATAFAKEYQNGMQFIGILPKETGEFALTDLDVESLLENKTTAYDVNALMPKLNFDTTADNIVDILKAQGVETVFDDEQSDMTGFIEMTDDEITYISDIIQKTKIELDENGTKAAAVTAITMDMATTAMPVEKEKKQVYLDRPFAFMIYDEANEQIVFMGKVVTL